MVACARPIVVTGVAGRRPTVRGSTYALPEREPRLRAVALAQDEREAGEHGAQHAARTVGLADEGEQLFGEVFDVLAVTDMNEQGGHGRLRECWDNRRSPGQARTIHMSQCPVNPVRSDSEGLCPRLRRHLSRHL